MTEELPGVTPSGGIGSAMVELAYLLGRERNSVTLFLVASAVSEEASRVAEVELNRGGVSLFVIRPDEYVHANDPSSRSLATYHALKKHAPDLDVLHFADFKGMAFHTLAAKRQGLAFADVEIVLQLHGPVRWTLEANRMPFTVPSQLQYDFMERKSIAWADHLVSPSDYLRQWVFDHGWVDDRDRIRVLKNVCSLLLLEARHTRSAPRGGRRLEHLVLFGRHEERKGFAAFCGALSLVHDELVSHDVDVIFCGNFGEIRDGHSGLFLIDAARDWDFAWGMLPGLHRKDSMRFLASLNNALVVVPSPLENSPYTVLETLALGLPILTSREGGAPELIFAEDVAEACVDVSNATVLADALASRVDRPLFAPRMSQSVEEIEDGWLRFHAELETNGRRRAPRGAESKPDDSHMPRVTVGITHYERPDRLLEAVSSMLQQDYGDLEIIVVDDGSRSTQTKERLDHLERMFARVGVTLVRRPNGYLGAARNTVLEHATGELVLFLDDDDIALPNLVSTLVTAQQAAGADVVVALNRFMPAPHRREALADPGAIDQRVSYVPSGGPLSLASLENCIGAATALFSIADLREIGGYSEWRDVGHEDYELYVRLLTHGKTIDVCPEPLYLYEVDKPSMISRTSTLQNFGRVAVAFEPARAAVAMIDVVSLTAGRSGAENARNRTEWVYRQSPAAELRLRLWREWPLPLDTLQMLQSVALAESNPKVQDALERSRAWLLSLQDAPSEAVEDRVRPRRTLTSLLADEPVQESIAPKLAEALLLLAGGQEFGPALGRFLRDAGTMSVDELVMLRRLPWREIAISDSRLVDDALATLERLPLPDEAISAATTTYCSVAYLSSRHDAYVRVAGSVVDRDEREYLAANPDVTAAVRAGRISNGLAHFVSSGRTEGRPGFERSAALGRELHLGTSKRAGLEALAATLGWGFGTLGASLVPDATTIDPDAELDDEDPLSRSATGADDLMARFSVDPSAGFEEDEPLSRPIGADGITTRSEAEPRVHRVPPA